MTNEVINMLRKEQQPDNIERLRSDLCKMLKYSRGRMNSQFRRWSNNLDVWNGRRCPDEQDLESRDNDEPEKMIVPMSYTQVMTFVTFAFMLFNQNNPFYQQSPTGNEDYDLLQASESMLQRDVRKNGFNSLLLQWLMDVARFGIAISKSCWKTETQTVTVTVPGEDVSMGNFTFSEGDVEVEQEFIKFEGNQVIPVSPFRFIPDMRLPLTRWKEGKFCADEQEYHIGYLKDLEEKGLLAGTEHLSPMSHEAFKISKRYNGQFPLVEDGFSPQAQKDKDDFMVLSTEINVWLNPRKYDLPGPNKEVLHLVVLGNDERVLRVEPADYLHGEFIYDVAQFTPDQHSKLNMALSDTIDALQDTVTWLINARIISLRQGLDRHLVVDPSVIDTTGLDMRSPIIMVRKGGPRTGIQNFIQQIQYRDMTQQNMVEAESLMRIMQAVTGVNENAMGQYSPGRRSANENRAANAGAASRMTLHATVFWEQLLAPLGRKMNLNLRQNVSFETFKKVVGESSPTPGVTLEELFALYQPSDVSMLIGNEDFFIFDNVGQTEKGFLAQSLQELVIALMSNPQAAMMTDYNITKLIDEIQYLRGIRNVARFKNNPNALGQIPGAPVQTVPPVPGGAVPVEGGVPAVPGQPPGAAV